MWVAAGVHHRGQHGLTQHWAVLADPTLRPTPAMSAPPCSWHSLPALPRRSTHSKPTHARLPTQSASHSYRRASTRTSRVESASPLPPRQPPLPTFVQSCTCLHRASFPPPAPGVAMFEAFAAAVAVTVVGLGREAEEVRTLPLPPSTVVCALAVLAASAVAGASVVVVVLSCGALRVAVVSGAPVVVVVAGGGRRQSSTWRQHCVCRLLSRTWYPRPIFATSPWPCRRQTLVVLPWRDVHSMPVQSGVRLQSTSHLRRRFRMRCMMVAVAPPCRVRQPPLPTLT